MAAVGAQEERKEKEWRLSWGEEIDSNGLKREGKSREGEQPTTRDEEEEKKVTSVNVIGRGRPEIVRGPSSSCLPACLLYTTLHVYLSLSDWIDLDSFRRENQRGYRTEDYLRSICIFIFFLEEKIKEGILLLKTI